MLHDQQEFISEHGSGSEHSDGGRLSELELHQHVLRTHEDMSSAQWNTDERQSHWHGGCSAESARCCHAVRQGQDIVFSDTQRRVSVDLLRPELCTKSRGVYENGRAYAAVLRVVYVLVACVCSGHGQHHYHDNLQLYIWSVRGAVLRRQRTAWDEDHEQHHTNTRDEHREAGPDEHREAGLDENREAA